MMKLIDTIEVNGVQWKLFTPMPARLTLPIRAQIARIDRTYPTVRLFGGIVSIVDPRTWTRLKSQFCQA